MGSHCRDCALRKRFPAWWVHREGKPARYSWISASSLNTLFYSSGQKELLLLLPSGIDCRVGHSVPPASDSNSPHSDCVDDHPLILSVSIRTSRDTTDPLHRWVSSGFLGRNDLVGGYICRDRYLRSEE